MDGNPEIPIDRLPGCTTDGYCERLITELQAGGGWMSWLVGWRKSVKFCPHFSPGLLARGNWRLALTARSHSSSVLTAPTIDTRANSLWSQHNTSYDCYPCLCDAEEVPACLRPLPPRSLLIEWEEGHPTLYFACKSLHHSRRWRNLTLIMPRKPHWIELARRQARRLLLPYESWGELIESDSKRASRGERGLALC